jgi:hypothetical protein
MHLGKSGRTKKEALSRARSGKETLKTGFRAKDAKNAKKLLQGELVEFVYESFDVTFEKLFVNLKRAINHRCGGTILIHPMESLRSLRPWRELIQLFRNFNAKQDYTIMPSLTGFVRGALRDDGALRPTAQRSFSRSSATF